jgi:phage terminase Nu1 subunit (DNA packaging protein)
VSAGTISSARKRVLEAQANRAELKLAHERGKLFDAKLAMQAWSGMVAAFRTRCLAIPRTLAEELTREAERGPAAVEVVLMREIRAALEALSGWEPPRPLGDRRRRGATATIREPRVGPANHKEAT